LKASISIALAFVVAAVLVTNSAPLYTNITASVATITASLSNKLGLEPANQLKPLVQSAADVETLTTADKQPSAPNKTAASAPTEPVVERVNSQSDVLFRQFQAWAAAQAHVTRAQPDQESKPAQSAPVKLAAPQPVVQKRPNRPVTVSNAPTKASSRVQHKPARPVQDAQVQIPPSLSAERQWTLRSE
jgi:hypothetical protein